MYWSIVCAHAHRCRRWRWPPLSFSVYKHFFKNAHTHTNRDLLLRISPPGAGLRNLVNPRACVSYCLRKSACEANILLILRLHPSSLIPSLHLFSFFFSSLLFRWLKLFLAPVGLGESSPLLSLIELPHASHCSIDLWGPSTCMCVYMCVCPVFIRLIKVSSSLICLQELSVSQRTHRHVTTSLFTCLKVAPTTIPSNPPLIFITPTFSLVFVSSLTLCFSLSQGLCICGSG